MSRSSFPWPRGVLSYPAWRNRHLLTGDTIPPSRVQGEASLTKCTPYVENQPSGHIGGLYEEDTRAIGLGEPPTAPILNRAFYALSCGLDMLAESYDADLDIDTLPGVTAPAPNFEIDLLTIGSGRVVYLGRDDTTDRSGLDPTKWCSNFVKLRIKSDGLPPIISATGQITEVADIRATSAGLSMYTPGNFPSVADVYPRGTTGSISNINSLAPADDTIEFLGGILPSGLPAAAALNQATGLFNYSLYERLLTNDAGEFEDAITICYASIVGPPDQFTVNRNDLVTKGWLVGDVIYTTHFAYCPTLVMTEAIPAAVDAALLHGRARTSAMSSPDISRFMDFLRLLDSSPTYTGLAPFSVEEPPLATGQRDFDYGNTLLRAIDSNLKGTTGFDARMRYNLTGGSQVDAYAGFLHRKSLVFASAGNTTLDVEEGASWNGNVVTLTAAPPAQFRGAASQNTSLIPGLDLIELRENGVSLGLFILSGITNQTQCTIRELNGVAAALAAGPAVPGTGDLTVFRPQARTGTWDHAIQDFGHSNVFTGDHLGSYLRPAAHLVGVGNADIVQGWKVGTGRTAGATDGRRSGRFKYDYTGKSFFSGEVLSYDANDLPLITQYGAMESFLYGPGGIGTIWNNANSESRGVSFTGISEGSAESWESRFAAFHFVDDVNGPYAETFLHLSTNGIPAGGLSAGDKAAVLFGLPGTGSPLALFTAGARDAGYLLAENDTGNMILHFGVTTAAGIRRDVQLKEVPFTAPPYGTTPTYPANWGFGANGSRHELQAETSYGWQGSITLFNTINLIDGMERTHANAWYYGNGNAHAWTTDANGTNTEANDPWVDFPIHLPLDATFYSVEVLYLLNTSLVPGGGNRGLKIYVFKDTPNFGTPPVGNPIITTLGTLELTYNPAVPGVDWADDTLTLPGPTPRAENAANSYIIRVVAGYKAAEGVTRQEIAGLRIRYAIRDMLPA